MGIEPIFLLSISRTGSTLIQRILAAHPGVATVSEPWVLLPQAYALREGGVDAEYVQPLMARAIEDFCATLPGGREEYLDEVRAMVLRLYEQAAGEGATHFLDKTPPYSLVPEEIISLFPEARFVFLWRNPLSVIASMIRTWGPWHPTLMSSDLYIGLPRLIAARERHRDLSYSVRFEDLVSGEESHWHGLTDYLGIEYDPESLTNFAEVELQGRMGDPTGPKQYSALSSEPEAKWRETLANPIRREWTRRYLRFLGRERIATMGYDQERMLAELAALPLDFDSVLGDAGRAIVDIAKEPIRLRTRRRRIGEPNVIRELLRT